MAQNTQATDRSNLEVTVRTETRDLLEGHRRLPRPEMILSIFGRVTRRGEWEPPERLRCVALFGWARLDFREALLPPGVTEVQATAIFGRVEILVPDDLNLEVNGTALLGSVDHHSIGGGLKRFLRDRFGSGSEAPDEEDAPFLDVRGVGIFGRVTVRVR